jgi:4,5-DOPA dioxygenase extradiol
MTLKDLHKSISELGSTPLMPMLFVGHGSPMNAVEDNEFSRQKYPSPGSPSLAQEVIVNIHSTHVKSDDQWGLDHGTWTILKYTYPLANIPVIQISIDHDKDAQWHYNLRIMRIAGNDFNAEYGYDWAFELNDILKNKLIDGDDLSLINYRSLHFDLFRICYRKGV